MMPSTPFCPDRISGAELQTMREAAGLSREALAQLVGVEARTVKHWEHGRAGVPADVAQVVQGAAQWVRTASAEALRNVRAQLDPTTTQLMGEAVPSTHKTCPCLPLVPVVLLRYRETAHMHPADTRQGLRADMHGAMVAQVVQALAADGVRARVAWFGPLAYAAWAATKGVEDTPAQRDAWAAAECLSPPPPVIPPAA